MAGSLADMVCRVIGRSASGIAEFGTGFFVAPNRVLTAAHVLWPPGAGSPATSAQVIQLAGGTEIVGPAGIKILRYYHEPVNLPNFHWDRDDFDAALLHLQHPMDGFQPIWRLVQFSELVGTPLWALSVAAAGLPSLGEFWHRGPGVARSWISFNRLFAGYVAERGFSGGPVVDQQGQIIGLHQEGNNVGGVDGSICLALGQTVGTFVQLDGNA